MGRTFKGRNVYDNSFKFSVIEEYLSSDLSVSVFCPWSATPILMRLWVGLWGLL